MYIYIYIHIKYTQIYIYIREKQYDTYKKFEMRFGVYK